MTAAGVLNMRIDIQSPTEIRGGSGSVKFEWVVFCSRMARFLPKGGREYQLAQATFNEVGWIVECRGRADITPKMRISAGDGRYFNILQVYSDDGTHPKNADMIKIVCQEGPVAA